MKKSFMTRALATGLSLAMAFSLSAATNVTTAEAASLMKASSKTVTEGKTAKAYMTSSMAKKYRIKSHKESTVAKKYISVAMMSSRKGLKITAKEGALAAANLEKKGVQVKINFVKASSAKAAKKATKIAKTATLKVVVKAKAEEKKVASDIAAVEVVGAKTVKVTFNGELAATNDVIVAVKKGTTELKAKAVTFTDAKTATVELEQSLTTGTYTLSATGVVTDKELTKDFSVDSEEYVAAIELTSDKAAMEGTDNSVSTVDASRKTNQVASVGYVLKNQYGEVVNTNTNSITWTVSTGVTVDNTDYTYKNGSGTLNIKTAITTSFIPGNEVFINAVLTNGTHVATMSGKVQIVLPAGFDKAEIAGVYNKTLKKMDTVSSTKLSATKNPYVYYLLFTAVDQYGNIMDSEKVAENATDRFTALSTNPIFITTTTSFETVDVDGKTYIAMKLAPGNMADKGGTATVQIISSSTGTKSTYEIVADAAGALDKFTLGNPAGYAVSGEKLEIPFTAVDQYGNAITSYDALNEKVEFTKSAGASFGFVKKADGTAKLVIDLTSVSVSPNQDTPVYLTSVVKANGNYSSSSINVKRPATPKSINGIKASSNKSTTLVYEKTAAGSVELTYKDLDILDQYGRVMSNDDVKKWLNADLSIVVTQGAIESSSAVKVEQDVAGSDAATVTLTSADTSKVIITAQADGSEKVTFSLVRNGKVIAGSDKDITFSTSTQKEFTSYTVDDLELFYLKTADEAQSTHAVTPAVFGVKADGSKVKLLPAYYDITTNAKDDSLTIADGGIKQGTFGKYNADDFKKADGSYQDVTVTVTIKVKDTKGAYVETLTKEMKLSNKAPSVAVAKFTSDVSDGKASMKRSTVGPEAFKKLLDAGEIKDQYGIKYANALSEVKISISNLEVASEHFTLTGNGTNTISMSDCSVGDTFTVTYTWGSVSISVDVILVD